VVLVFSLFGIKDSVISQKGTQSVSQEHKELAITSSSNIYFIGFNK
jgi:hypothetical protein